LSPTKEFTTAIEQQHPDDEDVPLLFMLDGHECKAYTPTDGQIAMTMAALGRHTSDITKMAGVIDFFVAVLDEDSHSYVVNRLMDRADPLKLEQVEEIIMWLMEEWSGRPTRSPSVSTQSRQSGGRKSKPRTTKSTSSRSGPASS
jgi:hypothetical protein